MRPFELATGCDEFDSNCRIKNSFRISKRQRCINVVHFDNKVIQKKNVVIQICIEYRVCVFFLSSNSYLHRYDA